VDKAFEHVQTLIDLRPKESIGYRMLADLLVRQGRTAEAVANYQKALQFGPGEAETLVAFGDALAGMKRLDEAEARYREAIGTGPSPWIAPFKLANLLVQRGRHAEAARYYAKALRLRSNPMVMNELAWILATHNVAAPPGTPGAVRLAEQACEQTQHQRPLLLDTLAAAYARAGRFTEAVRTAELALELARKTGPGPLVKNIEARRQLYLAGRPYDEPAPATRTAPASAASPVRE
jgi:tetratricopeptide (TPR) repeat protein